MTVVWLSKCWMMSLLITTLVGWMHVPTISHSIVQFYVDDNKSLLQNGVFELWIRLQTMDAPLWIDFSSSKQHTVTFTVKIFGIYGLHHQSSYEMAKTKQNKTVTVMIALKLNSKIHKRKATTAKIKFSLKTHREPLGINTKRNSNKKMTLN